MTDRAPAHSHGRWRRALSLVAAATVALTGGAIAAVAPASALPPSDCPTAGITVTPLHTPDGTPRPFYADFSRDSTNHSGFAGWQVSGASSSNLWMSLGGFTGGSVDLNASQPAIFPVLGQSGTGTPQAYAYLQASTASASAQPFTVSLYDGEPGAGGTLLCTYDDSFSAVEDIIAAAANKITGISVTNSSPALGTSFDIVATGNSGTVGAGIAGDQGPSGEGVFALAPAMGDSWPADAFVVTGLDLTIVAAGSYPGGTYEDYIRVYPPLDGAVDYTATYHVMARAATASDTAVTPVQTIASGTQVKYTGRYDAAQLIASPTDPITIRKSVESITYGGVYAITYKLLVENSAQSAVTLDSILDNPDNDGSWQYVDASATIDGSPAAVNATIGTIELAGPIEVPAAAGADPGVVTVYYTLSVAGGFDFTNTAYGMIGSEQVGGSAGTNTVTLDPAVVTVTTDSPLPSGTQYAPYAVVLTAIGGDGGPYTWALGTGALPAGLTLGSNGTLSGTPTESGTFTFQACATDALLTEGCKEFTLEVTAAAEITITTVSLPDGDVDVAYSATVAASGGDGGPYTFALNSGSLPAGLTLGEDGSITGTPTESGEFTIEVRATDGHSNTAIKSFTFTVNAPVPVEITTTSLGTGTVDAAYADTVLATGGDGGPYTFTLESGALPAGLTLNSDGTITGTPTESGTFTFTVRATDGASAFTTKELSITVNEAPVAVTVTTAALTGGKVGDAYSDTLAATGGDGGPYTWALGDGSSLPDGLTLGTDGVISGTPTTAGTYTVNVCATDSTPETGCKDLQIIVANADVVVTTPSIPDGKVGDAYEVTLAAEGGNGGPYTWQVGEGSTLPEGLTLGANGVLSGTPAAAGTYTFSVCAQDSDLLSGCHEYTMTVTNADVVVTTASLPGGTTGQAYSVTLAATGGNGGPYTWAVQRGSELPAGLTLSTDGVLSGTPTTPGTYTFSVCASDSDLLIGCKEFTIVIAAAPAPAPSPTPEPSTPAAPPVTPDAPAEPLPPVAADPEDTNVVTPAGKPVTVRPLDNQQPPAGESWDYSKMRLVDPASGALVTRVATSQGVWSLDPVSGAVTFTPRKGFTGKALVEFRIVTSAGTAYAANVEATVTKAKVRKASATVYFASGSADLTKAAKVKLDRIVAKAKGGKVMFGKVIGFVQATPFAGNDMSLSTARAKNVRAYLVSKGIKPISSYEGLGKASEPDWKARRATATITYIP